MPAFTYSSAEGNWTTSTGTVSKANQDFFGFSHYPNETYYEKYGKYNLNTDYQSPLFFIPTNCLKENSFQLPRVAMPIIAVVGDWNEATTMMAGYLQQLIEIQSENLERI